MSCLSNKTTYGIVILLKGTHGRLGDTDSTEVMIDYDEQGRVVATRSPSGFWNDQLYL